ncbi:monocarboxylate transporter 9-like isoform X2 [Toxotes jaculatrix]|uniref:monocarboxylate transporter 9-like isoform X2 n=1 Tax=Toxotes jaculatrix TaxID=941984 RepID=UPI001B3A9415|nr:monocarboxylate transporter 9-like isoform X2 [Toxotes jaculatrix]
MSFPLISPSTSINPSSLLHSRPLGLFPQQVTHQNAMSPLAPGSPAASALDGGWGWAIVASGFLALLLGYGSPQSVGVLYPEWLLTFGEGKAMTAWVGSLVAGVGLIVGPVCSVCVVNFGARPVTIFSGVMVAGGLMLSSFAPNVPFLIFSYGIVVGVGVGLLYAATLTITCLYFDKRRGLALGIVTTGASVGGFLYATVQSALIELLGLDGCLLIIGALALNVVACAGPMRPLTPPKYYLKQRAAILEQQLQEEEELSNQKPSAKDQVITTETKQPPVRRRSLFSCSAFIQMIKIKMRQYTQCLSSMLSLLQDRVLMALCISLFFFSLGNFPPQLFLEDLAQSSGLSEGVTSVSLVSLISIGAGVGKLGLGVMADVPRVDSILLYALTVGVSGLAVLLIPFASSYLDLQVLSVVLGFLSGNWTLTPYVTSQVVGMEKLAEAHGILMFFGGVGITLGPPVIGKTGNHTEVWSLIETEVQSEVNLLTLCDPESSLALLVFPSIL